MTGAKRLGVAGSNPRAVRTKELQMQIKSNVKAGGISIKNHNGALVRVKSNVKAGGISVQNHNQSLVRG